MHDVEVDKIFLLQAIELSKQCPPSNTAFSVGAVLVDLGGNIVGSGFSRATGDAAHAEEVALAKARAEGVNLSQTTLYSSLEPCGQRLSGKESCVEKILKSGIKRVVYALSEPPIFVHPSGKQKLVDSGVEAVVLKDLALLVRNINRHLFNE